MTCPLAVVCPAVPDQAGAPAPKSRVGMSSTIAFLETRVRIASSSFQHENYSSQFAPDFAF